MSTTVNTVDTRSNVPPTETTKQTPLTISKKEGIPSNVPFIQSDMLLNAGEAKLRPVVQKKDSVALKFEDDQGNGIVIALNATTGSARFDIVYDGVKSMRVNDKDLEVLADIIDAYLTR